MANTYIRARSPKGNVGVTDVVDAGELSAYSAGVLSGLMLHRLHLGLYRSVVYLVRKMLL